MNFTELKIKDAFMIESEIIEDERGFFGRQWCKEEFEAHGLVSHFVVCNFSFSKKTGTLRGMHYQVPPHQEVKLIRCTKGAIYDVIIDLRPESPTYKLWVGVQLRADSYKMLYVPERVAHGFQTLEDDTEVVYPTSQFYSPQAERGVRWDDPVFSIRWPETTTRIISNKDKHWADYVV